MHFIDWCKPQISTRVDCFWIKKSGKLNTFKTYLKEPIFSTPYIDGSSSLNPINQTLSIYIYLRSDYPKAMSQFYLFALPTDHLLICLHQMQSTSIRYLWCKLVKKVWTLKWLQESLSVYSKKILLLDFFWQLQMAPESQARLQMQTKVYHTKVFNLMCC